MVAFFRLLTSGRPSFCIAVMSRQRYELAGSSNYTVILFGSAM
jgi:hypothetical protein